MGHVLPEVEGKKKLCLDYLGMGKAGRQCD